MEQKVPSIENLPNYYPENEIKIKNSEGRLEITNMLHQLEITNTINEILEQPEFFIPLLENAIDTPSYFIPNAWKFGSTTIFAPGDKAVCLFFFNQWFNVFQYFKHYQTNEYSSSFFNKTYVFPNKYALALLLLYRPLDPEPYLLINGKQLIDVLNHNDFCSNLIFIEIDNIESNIDNIFKT